VGGLAQNVTKTSAQTRYGHYYSICTGSIPTEGKNWIKFTFGALILFGHAGFIKETG